MVEKIEQVVDALCAGGIRAKRGYPEEKYFYPDSPVAAVYLEAVQGQSVTVTAQIFAAKAADCEDCADAALKLLAALAGVCTVESCKFDRQMGLFSLRILVRWNPETETESEVEPEPEPEVSPSFTLQLDQSELPYVTAFSAVFTGELYQNTSEEGETSIAYNTKVWTLTVEELLPPETEPEEDNGEAFTLSVIRQGGTESYTQCRWDTIRRTETTDGVRQVRIAKTWEERTVS